MWFMRESTRYVDMPNGELDERCICKVHTECSFVGGECSYIFWVVMYVWNDMVALNCITRLLLCNSSCIRFFVSVFHIQMYWISVFGDVSWVQPLKCMLMFQLIDLSIVNCSPKLTVREFLSNGQWGRRWCVVLLIWCMNEFNLMRKAEDNCNKGSQAGSWGLK